MYITPVARGFVHCCHALLRPLKGNDDQGDWDFALAAMHIRHTDLGWDKLPIIFIGTCGLLSDESLWIIYCINEEMSVFLLEQNPNYTSTRWRSYLVSSLFWTWWQHLDSHQALFLLIDSNNFLVYSSLESMYFMSCIFFVSLSLTARCIALGMLCLQNVSL